MRLHSEIEIAAIISVPFRYGKTKTKYLQICITGLKNLLEFEQLL